MSDLLAGIRVLESATLFNGDTLGAHLGDLGADVIKIERPGMGDYLRHFLGQITPGNSPAHVQINRGKRSLTLDLRAEAGREVFWRLHATADVFVDGNASDACTRLGIGYEQQRAHKVDIVYCQYSGFGSDGPYAAIPTHGQMMDALAGAYPRAMGPDGFLHGAPHAGPMRGMDTGGEGTAAGAIHAAYHVAAALVQRARTGQGAFIDVAGTDGVIAQAWIAATYALNEQRMTDTRTLPAVDDGELTGAKYQYYECGDGHNVLFCCIEPKFWVSFCRAIGREDLVESNMGGGRPDGSPVDFGRDEDELRHQLQEIFSMRSLEAWMALAAEHDIPMGPAYRGIVEAMHDVHLRSRGTVHTQEHPKVGEFTYVGEAGKVAGQPFTVRRPAPDLGEHTRELLGELGFDDDELGYLSADGVI